MNNFLHPLARQHIINGWSKGYLPIIADEHQEKEVKLHLNVNYFSESIYKFYPLEEDKDLFTLFLSFLNEERVYDQSKVVFSLTPNHILFLSASEAINLLIRVFCEPQYDKIGIMSPTYPLYSFCARINNVEVINIPLYGKDFELINIEQILLAQLKVIFLPIPNNPIGSIPDDNHLHKLLLNFKGLIVIDEAYIEFTDKISLISYIKKYPNLIILRSFSKIWGLAGIRCGAIIASPLIINTLKSIQLPFTLPSHTQEIIKKQLTQRHTILTSKYTNKKQLEWLSYELNLLPIVRRIYKSHANFLSLEFIDGEEIYSYLLANNIVVRNIGTLIPNTLRISVGSIEQNKYLIQILRDFNQ